MTGLLESPLPGIFIGGLLAVIFVGGYLRTGNRWLLAGAAAALAVGAGLLILERQVETVREKIESRIESLAEDLAANRDREILDAIHSLAPEVRSRAEGELQRYEFNSVDVKRNLRIEHQPQHQPPQAVASFNVVVRIEQYPRPIPRFVKLTFWQDEDGGWRVIDYEHHPPQAGFQKQ